MHPMTYRTAPHNLESSDLTCQLFLDHGPLGQCGPHLVVPLAPTLERQQGELQCAGWRPTALNKGVPTTQQPGVPVPQCSVDRSSEFSEELENPDFYMKYLHF